MFVLFCDFVEVQFPRTPGQEGREASWTGRTQRRRRQRSQRRVDPPEMFFTLLQQSADNHTMTMVPVDSISHLSAHQLFRKRGKFTSFFLRILRIHFLASSCCCRIAINTFSLIANFSDRFFALLNRNRAPNLECCHSDCFAFAPHTSRTGL